MPDTTLIINGFSILDNPSVNTNSADGGYIEIMSGNAPFEDDDIVVFSVVNADANGEVTGSSAITGIVVYDNAADYFNDIPKYTYGPMNPGQTASIQGDVSGLGDTYLRFNANVLVSSDPGAPRFNQLLLAPEYDLANDLASGPIRIERYTDVDFDHDGMIDAGTTEVANAYFASDNNGFAAICVTRGTWIETDRGPKAVETLRVGDLVSTLDNGLQPIRWIGSRPVPGVDKLAPVHIRAGALGNMRDLWVSQNHRMLVRGPKAELLFGERDVLVAAKHLVDDHAIRIVPCAEVDYFHFMFDDHQIVFAEACPTESLYPGKQSLRAVTAKARGEILSLFPELEHDQTNAVLSRYELSRDEATVWRRSA
ncbi:Hint domain-containing protein [Thalassovita taeanensis]|uniref:Hint domain-containing protein n=1 Tax=Thalassovita taeanensis TaxID=657014 RepID=A0A1H9EUV1_9RHOB|nr:Hint domain-containing protein [Thalassovita taeanensis]SEQ29474.1 Hint domain-containing protein [Thalassovita taeanensis]